MVSKSQIKFVRQLAQKKQRDQHDLFVAEGHKVVQEFINENYQLHQLFTSDLSLFSSHQAIVVSQSEMKAMSALKTPSDALAVFAKPNEQTLSQSKLILALESIQDPGNLGTIIRLCDWFGIQDIVCSLDTVDCYNPKVIQASMGSISRVNITYLDLQKTLENNSLKTYGTYMQGDSIFEIDEIKNGVILFGNEANGINPHLSKLIDKKLSIPRFGKLKKTESLNVASALSIVLSENARKSIEK